MSIRTLKLAIKNHVFKIAFLSFLLRVQVGFLQDPNPYSSTIAAVFNKISIFIFPLCKQRTSTPREKLRTCESSSKLMNFRDRYLQYSSLVVFHFSVTTFLHKMDITKKIDGYTRNNHWRDAHHVKIFIFQASYDTHI